MLLPLLVVGLVAGALLAPPIGAWWLLTRLRARRATHLIKIESPSTAAHPPRAPEPAFDEAA